MKEFRRRKFNTTKVELKKQLPNGEKVDFSINFSPEDAGDILNCAMNGAVKSWCKSIKPVKEIAVSDDVYENLQYFGGYIIEDIYGNKHFLNIENLYSGFALRHYNYIFLVLMNRGKYDDKTPLDGICNEILQYALFTDVIFPCPEQGVKENIHNSYLTLE